MRVIPNHVTNKLLFHPCTEQRFNEILADLQKEGAEPGSIDLGRIIPEPEGLFMGDLGVEEMKKYKDNNWYDWRIKHWNTKWNAYGFEPPTFSGDTGTMTFRTANCSPFPVIFKLSQKYTYPFDDDCMILGNEEAKLCGMEGNRRLFGSVYAGPIFVTRDNGEGDLCGLTDEQVKTYGEMFAVPEDISPAEVQRDVGFTFYSWG